MVGISFPHRWIRLRISSWLIPSRNDDYDVALWEHHSHLLAHEAGVTVAKTRVLGCGEKYHVLLSRRFDRLDEGKRVHFASALTLLGLTDGCDANTGNGYLDIADFILQNCCNVTENLHQLYRRVAFNIAICNTDDHFRNHGFLLTPKGWTLSPAYDMNPSLWHNQSLLINSVTNESDLAILLDSPAAHWPAYSNLERCDFIARTSNYGCKSKDMMYCLGKRRRMPVTVVHKLTWLLNGLTALSTCARWIIIFNDWEKYKSFFWINWQKNNK